MNKHIIMVVKWMRDKNSVTQQELATNSEKAYAVYADCVAAYDTYADATYADYVAATADAAAAYYAANAANVAAYDADAYATYADYVAAYAAYCPVAAEKWLNRYFEVSGSSKQTYLDEIGEA